MSDLQSKPDEGYIPLQFWNSHDDRVFLIEEVIEEVQV
jgi:hypothetical protein